MLLQRLVGYSQRISLPPCLYAETPVDWLIDLDANGAPRGMVDLRQGSGKQKRGQSHPAPTLGNLRTSAIMPLLFCDNGGYVLGLAAKGKKTSASSSSTTPSSNWSPSAISSSNSPKHARFTSSTSITSRSSQCPTTTTPPKPSLSASTGSG
jgi:hypothetical protein